MVKRRAAWLVATVFGVGTLRPAPGTWGALVAALAGAGLVAHPGWLAAGVVAASLAGVWAIPRVGGEHDPGWVVIDEVAGQWLAMLGLAGGGLSGWRLAVWVAAVFVAFRVLDVAKPGPVGWADRHDGPGWVVADDLVAGGMTAGMVLAGRLAAVWLSGA
ncbi:MAG: phosphatidylglycerophosphatase A family protein [Janthinobacterium lividum]